MTTATEQTQDVESALAQAQVRVGLLEAACAAARRLCPGTGEIKLRGKTRAEREAEEALVGAESELAEARREFDRIDRAARAAHQTRERAELHTEQRALLKLLMAREIQAQARKIVSAAERNGFEAGIAVFLADGSRQECTLNLQVRQARTEGWF